jgi:Ran-binding protein 1
MSSEEPPKEEETKPEEATAEKGEVEKAAEEESTATFEPVVKLDVVEVQTGEEEEEALHTQRAKLFIFGETLLDKGSGKKSWRERGIGDIRLLKHNEHQKIRLLMRQEKTMKIIANHVVDPRIKLEPNAGSDRSWVWSAFDFAEGELVETVFAARFSDSDIANDFKTKFEEAQSEMEKLLAGEDATTGGAEADEAAAALEGLKTKDDDDDKKE